MLKKAIGIILILTVIIHSCITVSAFTFPEPNWGNLYSERLKMVQETEFELYAEAPTDTAPYYGEKFEPRGGAYLGSVVETSEKLRPLSSYLTNIDDMNYSDLYYPANQMVRNDNVITMVGWTIYDMANVNFSHVRKTLETLNQYNKPMLIRFANEMNCSNLGNDPNLYVKIFRQVADMIHEYPNLGVVWSPNDMGALDRPFEYFYPGDNYVDWIGISSYSIKYFQGNQNTSHNDSVFFMTGDYAWATNKIKPFMEFLKKNNINKPIMISEGGVATANIYGEEYQSWTTPRLRNMLWYLVMKYPQIKMINYFDIYRDNEKEKFDISKHSYAVDIFNEAKTSGAYITEYGKLSEFVFQPAKSAGTLIASDGIIPLYTLAYIEKQPDIAVTYHLDGKWYHVTSSIPYRCNLNISNLSDGSHTLKISSSNLSKEYTFYKKGQYISFGGKLEQPTIQPMVPKNISVVLNGNMIAFDQPPVIENGRTLVPLRAIFEALGANVEWNAATQTVTSTKGNTTISMTIGKKEMYKNNKLIKLDVPPQLVSNRTLVPVRAVAEGFDCKVDWDETNRKVIITK